jgi:uncharacterized 2Fe-2S/4Fe-4S cluster protein (DUF4445 family)
MSELHNIALEPSGRQGQVLHGINLRTAIRGLGVDIESICAENATCGKCRVVVEEGAYSQYNIVSSQSNLSPANLEETQYFADRPHLLGTAGSRVGRLRLACQARILGDVVVTIPDESLAHKQVVRKSARERRIEIRPAVRKYLVEMNPPTLLNPKADWERLASGVATSMELVQYGNPGLPRAGELTIDYACLRSLPEALRRENWRVTVSVWQDREIIRVEPGYNDALYGAAVDIGTTTVALYLCDLDSGAIVAAESAMNPQIPFGEDVMSRIQFTATDPGGLETLHKAIIRTLNQLLVKAARSARILAEDIVDLTVVGNTTMVQLFLNVPCHQLGVAPFAPVVHRSLDIKARELRLALNRASYVHVLPAIASFIGADTTGVLLAEEPHEQDDMWLIIDVGTNAELVLGNRKKLICASTPTGPAFEGASIEFGMRAAPGAIEHMRIDASTLKPHWKLIGAAEWDLGKPKGLCGSAIVDAVAELLKTGALDATGRLLPGAAEDGRIRGGAQGAQYVIAYASETNLGVDLCLTQKDIRQIQLAKSALFVAAESLLSQFGIRNPDKILLAGAFGSFMNKANAVAIGMIPEIPLDRIFVVGNSAGDGARIALLNTIKRHEAGEVARRLVRYELPADPEFQSRFIRAMSFGDATRKGQI